MKHEKIFKLLDDKIKDNASRNIFQNLMDNISNISESNNSNN